MQPRACDRFAGANTVVPAGGLSAPLDEPILETVDVTAPSMHS
jgi:hypothetical protein